MAGEEADVASGGGVIPRASLQPCRQFQCRPFLLIRPDLAHGGCDLGVLTQLEDWSEFSQLHVAIFLSVNIHFRSFIHNIYLGHLLPYVPRSPQTTNYSAYWIFPSPTHPALDRSFRTSSRVTSIYSCSTLGEAQVFWPRIKDVIAVQTPTILGKSKSGKLHRIAHPRFTPRLLSLILSCGSYSLVRKYILTPRRPCDHSPSCPAPQELPRIA